MNGKVIKAISENMKWHRPLIVLIIFSHLIGCAKWSVIEKPEDRYILENEPKWVEIELCSNEKIMMLNAHVRGDSLIGTREQIKGDPRGSVYFEYNYSIHLNAIKQFRVRKFDKGATAGLILLGFIILGVIINGMINDIFRGSLIQSYWGDI